MTATLSASKGPFVPGGHTAYTVFSLQHRRRIARDNTLQKGNKEWREVASVAHASLETIVQWPEITLPAALVYPLFSQRSKAQAQRRQQGFLKDFASAKDLIPT